MKELADLLIELGSAVPLWAGASGAGVELAVTQAELQVPLEARFDRDGGLRVSLPRGRLATGFQLPHAHLCASFCLRERER